MLRNYLVTALRNLARNRLYAAISILGLAVAFAAAILIAQFVRNELSYDTWLPGYQHVFKIAALIEVPGRSSTLMDQNRASLKAELDEALPGKAVFTRLSEDLPLMRRRPGVANVAERSFAWVDPNFFAVFPLPALAGDLRTALQQPDTVVITRGAARKYFGRDLPVGDTLEVQETKAAPDLRFRKLRVTAVLDDLPANTNLTSEIFASGRTHYSLMDRGGYTFARLAPEASVPDLQRALDIAERPLAAAAKAAWGASKVSGRLLTLPEAHFVASSFPPPIVGPTGNRSAAYGAAGVGGLILLVAAINFVTLLTARAAHRGVEVGVRKATGATRFDLMVQFIGEALLQVALSLLIGAALSEVLVGPFNAFSQRGLVLDFGRDRLLLASVVGVGLCTGLLASIYPALVLSSFRPMAVLKGGTIQTSGSPLARQALVTVQFAVLAALILSTATFDRQTRFALAQGLGTVDANRIVSVFTSCDSAFSKEVKTLPGVAAAACSSTFALNLPTWQDTTPVQVPGGHRTNFAWAHVDFSFFELYGVRPLAGRLFSSRYGEDTLKFDVTRTIEPSVVINETGARVLGFSDPRKAVGQRFTSFLRPNGGPYAPRVSEIVGVVPDMPANVRAPTGPAYYYIFPHGLGVEGFDVVSIRMGADDIPGTVKAIEATWKRTGNARPIDDVFLAQARQAANLDLVIQRGIVGVGATLAALIACLGLFALSAYTTERRTKEIGVRKAMGADTGQVVLLLLWQFTIPVLAAVVIALPLGFLAMNDWLNGFAYHVPLSAWTFVLAAAIAVIIAWATVSYQSFMIARARPSTALRYE